MRELAFYPLHSNFPRGAVDMLVAGEIRALIVDDNAYARSSAATSLRSLGLSQITELANAPEALLALLAEPFDLLLLDWYLPDMNGASLLRIIRDARFGPKGQLCTVVMTAYPSRETFSAARNLGATAALPKPLATAQLASILQRQLGGWDFEPDKQDDAIFL